MVFPLASNFTLVTLLIAHKGKTLFDVRFVENDFSGRKAPLSSVIIGINGAGKSYLLTVITEVLRAVVNRTLEKEINMRYQYYRLEYIIGNNTYTVEIKGKTLDLQKNNKPVNIHEIELPNKILAVSYMVNDKFVFKPTYSDIDDRYEYLGIRQTSNAAWTSSLNRRICDALIEHSAKKSLGKVTELLNFLNFDSTVDLIFEPELKTFFKSKLTESRLQKRVKKYKRSEDYRSISAKKIKEKEVQDLINFVNVTAKQRDIIEENGRKAIKYSLKLTIVDQTSVSNLLEDNLLLQWLVDIKLLKPPRLILYKEGQAFDFEYASSGEKHLLFTLINISTKIETNSLVLIDEPEISLHPNWQMNYVNCLKRVFVDYLSCHFVLATHSHYIVSDLEPETSSLVVLTANHDDPRRVRTAELLGYSTYAWSAENILYNVFEVRTTRNFYFEMELRQVINMIEKKTNDLEGLKTKVDKLAKFSFDSNDPINLVLQEAERYLKHAKDRRQN